MATDEYTAPTPEGAGRAVEELLGHEVVRVELPRRRRGLPAESFRCWLDDGRTAIATCRPTATRTAYEAHVLRQLFARGAPVPRVLAAEGAWLVQEDLGSLRVSQRLAELGPRDAEPLLHAAARALVSVHEAGRDAGLAQDAPPPEKATRLLEARGALAARAGIGPPRFDAEALGRALAAGVGDAFVKTDARPARAVVRREGVVVWFDWARCGRGHRVRDLVWLLGDEAVPEWPEVEEAVLDARLASFIEGLDAGRTHFAVYGVLHLCRRLEAILRFKGEGDWWPREECLDADHPIVTEEAYRTLARRGARWATRHALVEGFEPFFRQLA